MFGTLRVSRCQAPEEYGWFRKYYCGLCHLLAADYGALSRICVSYDVTFFYLLISSLTDRSATSVQIACPVSYRRVKPAIVVSQIGEMAAAVNMYLAGMKIRDDIFDSGKISGKVVYRILRAKEEKAAAYLKSLGIDTDEAERIFTEQKEAETTGHTLNEFSYATEVGLGFLFREAACVADLDALTQELLFRAGKGLGRIIYILDSFVDYPADLRCQRFNALRKVYGERITLKEEIPQNIRVELLAEIKESLMQVIGAIERLEFVRNKAVIDAVISSLENRISQLVEGTSSMLEMERKVRQGGAFYKFTHPQHLWRSQLAARRRRDSDCCCCDDLCTLWICCDAADCDCDTAEGCVQGDCCEFTECCG